MKKLVLLLIVMVSWSISKAQDCSLALENFDDVTKTTHFGEHEGAVFMAGVANPHQNIDNNSSLCGHYDGSNSHSFGNVILTGDFQLPADQYRLFGSTIMVQVWSSAIGEITMSLRDSTAALAPHPAGRHSQYKGKIEVTNEWTTIYFTPEFYYIPDESTISSKVNQIEIQFGTRDIYVDNITVLPYSIIDDFDNARNNAILEYSGNLIEGFANASDVTNSSESIGLHIKEAENGNSGIIYELGEIQPSQLISGHSSFSISTTTNDPNIRVSLINYNKYKSGEYPSGVNSEYEVDYSKSGPGGSDWLNCILTLTETPDLTTTTDEIDAILLQFSPGIPGIPAQQFDQFSVLAQTLLPVRAAGNSQVCPGVNDYDYYIPQSDENLTYYWTTSNNASLTSGDGTDSVSINFQEGAPTATIHVSVTDGAKCPSVKSSTTVSVNNTAATSNAGSGNTHCIEDYHLLGGEFTGANSAEWSTTLGKGTIENGLYSPVEEDLTFGLVDLHYTTVGGNCGTATDFIYLTMEDINKIKVVSDTFLCAPATSISILTENNKNQTITWYDVSGGDFNEGNETAPGESILYHPADWDLTPGASFEVSANFPYNHDCGSNSFKLEFIYLTENHPKCLATGTTKINNLTEVVPSISSNGHFLIQTTDKVLAISVTSITGRQETYYEVDSFTTLLKGVLIVKVKTSSDNYTFKVHND